MWEKFWGGRSNNFNKKDSGVLSSFSGPKDRFHLLLSSWEITWWCSDSRVTARDQRKYQSQLDEDLEQGSLRIKGEQERENSSFRFLHQFRLLSFEMSS